MARKLKTFQTSLGSFDLAIAAPSMKAALEAWGADSNLFHQGAAKESDDPDVVAATMAKPGVILKRPVGSDEPFKEHAELLRLSGNETSHRRAKSHAKPTKHPPRKADDKGARGAALNIAPRPTRARRTVWPPSPSLSI
jgi:colicin import membrane protein